MSFSPGVMIRPVTAAATLSFEPMQQIFAFWQERGNGNLPSRSDFLIEEFLPWAGHVGMVRPEGDPVRFKVTMANKTMIDLNKVDATGKYFDEYMPAEALEFGCGPYLMAMADRVAVTDSLVSHILGDRSFRRLVLPCADGDGPVNYFIIAIYYDQGFVSPLHKETLYDRFFDNNITGIVRDE
tara:strand:- start:5254 stop:5802 length:549 start_codon:yes stop_codon:yes gene_type:complete